jgi:hypothetical protein
MNDFIQGIGPVDRDVDAVYRVEPKGDEAEKREQQQPKRRPPRQPAVGSPQQEEEVRPVEGEDGHLHIDVRA